MSDELFEEEILEDEDTQLSRRGLLVTGGLAAAGLTALGSPASRAFAAATASTIKVAVVTHGDTGSFWSVFKRGVDQAAKDQALVQVGEAQQKLGTVRLELDQTRRALDSLQLQGPPKKQ